MDERAGAFKAVTHLIGAGHRRIAVFDNGGAHGNHEKLDGYKAALAAGGIEYSADLFVMPGSHSVLSGSLAMETLAGRNTGATAVFAATDLLALGALRYCARNGISVPADLAIFGFDNIEVAEYAVIALSSVDYDTEAVTKLAIDRVLELINAGNELPRPRLTRVEPDLVIRESTGRPASQS